MNKFLVLSNFLFNPSSVNFDIMYHSLLHHMLVSCSPVRTAKVFTQNMGKEREKKLLPKIEEISRGKAHTNALKFIQNILTITDVFLNQKRVNICEHMVKIASREGF